MAKSELIARQSRRPSGWLGAIVARVMAIETAALNEVAVQRLALRNGEAVLEIGCGHGRTLAALAQTQGAFLAGIDPSDVMVGVARKRLKRWIDAGHAQVELASSAAIPHPDARFDAALAVHVVYFWREPRADLAEIRRVLRPGGRLLLGYRPRDEHTVGALPATVYTLRTASEIEKLLDEVGFAEIRSTVHAVGSAHYVFTEARRP